MQAARYKGLCISDLYDCLRLVFTKLLQLAGCGVGDLTPVQRALLDLRYGNNELGAIRSHEVRWE
jgi:hypothetical protein